MITDFPKEDTPIFCHRCGRDAHLFRVQIGGVGAFCSRECAEAAAAESERPTGKVA